LGGLCFQLSRKQAQVEDEFHLTNELQRLGEEMQNESKIPSAPPGWRCPGAPDDWKPSKSRRGQPEDFASVDNPGGWDSFSWQPMFKKTIKKETPQAKSKKKSNAKNLNEEEADKSGPCLHHSLPTGATPVPLKDGKRVVENFEFHHKGWKNDGPLFRDGATRDNLFPQQRAGALDLDALKHLGLTLDRMREADGAPDALFFHQLLLPMHNIDDEKVLTVPRDPRKGFYSNMLRWTNLHVAGELGILCGGHGHEFCSTSPAELLKWDGTVVMDGVLGGTHGSFLSRFQKREGNELHHEAISKTFTKELWLEIKRTCKLWDNLLAKKKGEEGCDPAHKHDYMFDVIVHNVNAMSLFMCQDLCLDETSYAFNGWGELGTGLFGLIVGKPGITRGGQTVLVSDVDKIHPRACLHRHKLHPNWFTLPGPNEMALIWEKLLTLLEGDPAFFCPAPSF